MSTDYTAPKVNVPEPVPVNTALVALTDVVRPRDEHEGARDLGMIYKRCLQFVGAWEAHLADDDVSGAADEKLTPERAVRLLRAKGAELETQVHQRKSLVLRDIDLLRADIALIAQLLADHIERSERVIERLSVLAEVTYPPPSWPVENQR